MEQPQKTLKDEALESEPIAKSKNITELPQVLTALFVEQETFTNNEGKEVEIEDFK
jgi:hypothetical protein